MFKDRQGVSRQCGAFRHMYSQICELDKYIIHIMKGNILLYSVVYVSF